MAHCDGQASNETTFMYVGPHTDVSQLMHLACSETSILYVEPLTWWGNQLRLYHLNRRIHEAKAESEAESMKARPGAGRVTLDILQKNGDRLFECDHEFGLSANEVLPELRHCRPNITLSSVQQYAAELERELTTRLPMCSAAASEDGVGRPRVRVRERSVSTSRIQFTLSYARRRVFLVVLISRVQDVDLQLALTGPDGRFRPISTLCYVGVGPAAGAAASKVCNFRRDARPERSGGRSVLTPTVRHIHGAETWDPLALPSEALGTWLCHGRYRLSHSVGPTNFSWTCPRSLWPSTIRPSVYDEAEYQQVWLWKERLWNPARRVTTLVKAAHERGESEEEST